MQKKYADSGKFSVVLSYVQALDSEATDFLEKEHGGIPVYDQLHPDGAECGRGIPDAYLFDHTGKMIKHGHPSSLYDLVDDLVKAVPDPIPPGILGEFEPTLLVKECKQLQDPRFPVNKVRVRLEKGVAQGGPEGDEAREILRRIAKWAPEELERIEKRCAKRPAQGAWDARLFAQRFKGYDPPLVKRALKLHDEIEDRPGMKLWLRALADLDKGAEGGSKGKRFVQRGRKSLEAIIEDWDLPKDLREEAKAKVKELDAAGP